MANYCSKCGAKLKENADVCLKCGNLVIKDNPPRINKSKIVAGLLGIFLGGLGIHNFYLGYNSKAIVQLLLTVLSCLLLLPITAIWGFIEGILILTGEINKDAKGNSLVD